MSTKHPIVLYGLTLLLFMAVGIVGNLFLGSSLSLTLSCETCIYAVGNTKEVRVENFLMRGATVALRVARRLFYEFRGEAKKMNVPIVDESYALSPGASRVILGNMIPAYGLLQERSGVEGEAKGSRFSRCIQYGLYHRNRFLCEENPEGTTRKLNFLTSKVVSLNKNELNFWVSVLDTTFLVLYTRFLPYFSCDMFGIKASYQNYGYIRGAELGFPPAQFELAKMYENGKGVGKDYAEAVKWYRKAAEQGNTEAQYSLGECYEYGHGVSRDYAEAVKWYRKAAEQGNAEAQYNLGACYAIGRGVSKDMTEAVKWYRKAADQRYAQAQCEVGECYYYGKGVNKDYAEAVKWYRAAADQGNESAQYSLGECYEYGHGVSKDYAEAKRWYLSAAEHGNTDAMNKVGEILERLQSKL